MKPLALIAAMAKNRVIGNAGAIPWHLPEDLKHFKAVTQGHAIIMGRATWDSIGRPLPKRRNIVVSRNPDLKLEGAEVFGTLLGAVQAAQQIDVEPFVIGGAQLYAQSLALATKIHLTIVRDSDSIEGDTYFPRMDPDVWVLTGFRSTDAAHYCIYERV